MKGDKIPITFRIPEELYEWSKTEAERVGIPQTAVLLQLIDDGRSFRNLKLNINCPHQ